MKPEFPFTPMPGRRPTADDFDLSHDGPGVRFLTGTEASRAAATAMEVRDAT